MSEAEQKIPAYWVQGIARKLGEETELIRLALGDAGIDHAEVFDPHATITYQQELDFLDAAAKRTGRHLFGAELGVAMDPRRTSLLAYLLLNSVTLGDGLRNVERYLRLVRGASTTVLEDRGDRVALVIDHEDPIVHRNRHHSEFVVGASLASFRIATGTDLRPVEVRFLHERRSHADDLSRVLGGPVSFGCPRFELILSAESLALELLEADLTLLAILVKHAEQLLAETRPVRPTLRHRVERALLEKLQREPPSSDIIAAELGLSARTLTRKLAEEGCTFRRVTDELRLKLAESYLADPALSLSEIAFLLGYADQSSFTTAFKRWTGHTPGERRARPSV